MERSLPSRERGLKFFFARENQSTNLSLPSRERGLKLNETPCPKDRPVVAPLAGAWIEIAYYADDPKNATGRSPRGSVD